MQTKMRQRSTETSVPEEACLYDEIARFGGEQQVTVTQKAIGDMEKAIRQNVADAPDAFGACASEESQRAATAQIMGRVTANYLKHLASDLRKHSGYIQVLGHWVHRSVITFLVYTLMASISVSIFIPKVLSPVHGDFAEGIVGLIVVIGCGIAILIRVRK